LSESRSLSTMPSPPMLTQASQSAGASSVTGRGRCRAGAARTDSPGASAGPSTPRL
jgi:hypothetical protein